MQVLVIGSSGLIGSKVVEYYDREGHQVVGVDNNVRAEFFGKPGDTSWNLGRLKDVTNDFAHYSIDIRDRIVAGAYRDFLSIVLGEPAVIAVVAWGLSDRYIIVANLESRKQRNL